MQHKMSWAEIETGVFIPNTASEENFVAKKTPQYIAALTATIGAFGLGTVIGWSSPCLPDIEKRGDLDGLKADSEAASWIASIILIGGLFAGVIGGYLVEKIGRKNTMLALAPAFVGGWLLIGFGMNFTVVLLGRFVTGFCGASFTLTVPIYVSEIAESSIRGLLSNMLALVACVGILFTYILGSFIPWNILSVVCSLVPIIFAIAMSFMPESPAYLISKGKNAEARKALKWLRGATDNHQIDVELKLIDAGIKDNQSKSVSFKDLMVGQVLKPTAVSMMLMLLQQVGGINAVLFYAVDIFKGAGTGIDENLSAIIIAAVQVVFVGVSTLLVERLGRKLLLVVSELGMTLSLLALGVYFYIKENDEEKAGAIGWLPLTSLVVYIITYNLAMGPLPWTMMGELLPPHVKSVTSSLATAFCWGLGFFIAKFFKDMLSAFTAAGCYWIFSACSFAGFIYCLTVVPETQGKSLEEIQRHFSK